MGAEFKQLAGRVGQIEKSLAGVPSRHGYIPPAYRYQKPGAKAQAALTTEEELQLIWKQLDALYLTVERLRKMVSQ